MTLGLVFPEVGGATALSGHVQLRGDLATDYEGRSLT